MEKILKRLTAWAAALAVLILALRPGQNAALPVGGGAMVQLEDHIPLAALTFDDGPGAETTARLLDGLALREVQATFFLVGERIEGNETLIERMKTEGHQVGVHSYSHIRLTALSQSDFSGEVDRVRSQLTALLGEGSYWLRPPYGLTDSSVKAWAQSPIVLWSVDPEDWKDRDTGRIVQAVLSHVGDGDIILFHDIYDSSVDAALQVADALLEQGYCLVTVEQLLALRGETPENGALYTRLALK